jgi:hypothetical protein
MNDTQAWSWQQDGWHRSESTSTSWAQPSLPPVRTTKGAWYPPQQQQQKQEQQPQQQQHNQQQQYERQHETPVSLINAQMKVYYDHIMSTFDEVLARHGTCRQELQRVQGQVESLQHQNTAMSTFIDVQAKRYEENMDVLKTMREDAAADRMMRTELRTEIKELHAKLLGGASASVVELNDVHAEVSRPLLPSPDADTAVHHAWVE